MPHHVSAPSALLLLLFRPLALVHADSHTDIRYYQADAGVRCESDGYADILTNEGCEAAANNLSLSDTTVCGTCPVTNNNDFPNGCHEFGINGGGGLFSAMNDPPVSNDNAPSAGVIKMLCQTSDAFEICRTWYTWPTTSLQKSGNPSFQYHSWYEGCAYGFLVGGNQAACEALCAASQGCCVNNNYGWDCASNSCSGGGCCSASSSICQAACAVYFSSPPSPPPPVPPPSPPPSPPPPSPPPQPPPTPPRPSPPPSPPPPSPPPLPPPPSPPPHCNAYTGYENYEIAGGEAASIYVNPAFGGTWNRIVGAVGSGGYTSLDTDKC